MSLYLDCLIQVRKGETRETRRKERECRASNSVLLHNVVSSKCNASAFFLLECTLCWLVDVQLYHFSLFLFVLGLMNVNAVANQKILDFFFFCLLFIVLQCG